MKKSICFLFMMLLLIVRVNVVVAGEFEELKQQELEETEVKVMPRFFIDRLLIKTDEPSSNDYTLIVFTNRGQRVGQYPLNLSSGFCAHFTHDLPKGEYAYFIRENNKLVVRGTFVK